MFAELQKDKFFRILPFQNIKFLWNHFYAL